MASLALSLLINCALSVTVDVVGVTGDVVAAGADEFADEVADIVAAGDVVAVCSLVAVFGADVASGDAAASGDDIAINEMIAIEDTAMRDWVLKAALSDKFFIVEIIRK